MTMSKTDAAVVDLLLRAFHGETVTLTLGDLAGLADRAHKVRGEGLTGKDVAELSGWNLYREIDLLTSLLPAEVAERVDVVRAARVRAEATS